MYSILFHVSGIAIVEICFYFYYIGPMETVIFENKVKKMINEPFNTIPLLPSDYNYLERYFSVNNQTDILIEDRNEAVKKRKKQNNNLFVEIILYWTLLCTIDCLSFLAHYIYKRYGNTRFTDTSVHSEQGIELENIPLYRISTQSNESLEITICTEERKKVSKKVLYYFFFGCSILGFQYFFFQNIVLKYDPLSTEEVKYILYTNVEHELYEEGIIDL